MDLEILVKERILWVLEVSAPQGCFHVQPLRESIEKNLNVYTDGSLEDNPWVTLFCGSRDDCYKMAARLEGTLSRYQQPLKYLSVAREEATHVTRS